MEGKIALRLGILALKSRKNTDVRRKKTIKYGNDIYVGTKSVIFA